MVRSLYTGISSLRTNQQRMDVTANNLSNVNTAGYKSSRAMFKTFMSQALSSSAETNPEETRGGRGAMQIGLGVNLGSIDRMMSVGNTQVTNNPYDIMLDNPEDFLIVSDLNGLKLTRAGNLDFDQAGNLIVNGYKVYGWDTVYNEKTKEYEIDKKEVTPISISPDKQKIGAKPSTQVEFEGNLNASTLEDVRTSYIIYDSLGNSYNMPLLFKYNNELECWSYEIEPAEDGNRYIYRDGQQDKPVVLNYTSQSMETGGGQTGRSQNSSSLGILGFVNFDTEGHIIPVAPDEREGGAQQGNPSAIGNAGGYLKPPSDLPEGRTQFELFVSKQEGSVVEPDANFGEAGTGSIVLDFTGLTQFGNEEARVTGLSKDGQSGEWIGGEWQTGSRLTDVSISPDGKIIGRYSNDKTRLLGQIATSQVDNPYGLESVGDNLYATTANSGAINRNGAVSSLKVGALEMSNVDLGVEATTMIITQRAFSASTTIITTSDQMLQSAINLKR